jgi:hypothetical protein
VHGSGTDHGDVIRLVDLARRALAVEYRIAPSATPHKTLLANSAVMEPAGFDVVAG